MLDTDNYQIFLIFATKTDCEKFCHLFDLSKVWNPPTYSIPIPETPKYPIDYKEPPLIDDREPIEINVKKATR